MSSLRGKVAIVGAADTLVGKLPQFSATGLCIDAARRAMADAGITKDKIDGLITCNSMAEPYMYHAEAMAEHLQIFPRYCMAVGAGGSTTFSILHHAASAIVTGMCNTVLITMADSLRTGLTRDQAMKMQSSAGHPQFEIPFGPTVPAFYALIARAHMDRYGTTAEHFAAIAVACRKHACLNPAAEMRTPITIEDVINSRMIADPLHLLDCSLVSDGGSAIIMTSAERAADFPHQPVYLLGVGEGTAMSISARHRISPPPSPLNRASGLMRWRAWPARHGLRATVRLFHADRPAGARRPRLLQEGRRRGFRRKRQHRAWGTLPVNTHGGLLSHCHPGNPGSMFALTETVTQLRGKAGARQVEGAEVALVHGQGGIMSSHTTVILGRDRS